jgi:hypothetical protein
LLVISGKVSIPALGSLIVRGRVPQPRLTERGRLATEQGWRTVIVVTFRPHISRARYILEQCFDGQVIMIESTTDLSAGYWIWTYVYQTAGYIRAALQAGC